MSDAKSARMAAGLSVEAAAKRARISADYLKRVERRGAPYSLARCLARIYRCRIDLFLISRVAEPPKRRRGRRNSSAARKQ